jgi:hypothetical protein
MRRPLEVALKDALSDASTRLDTTAAVGRLTAVDYGDGGRPARAERRPARARKRWAAVGLAGLPTAAAIVAVIVLLSSGTAALRQPASTGRQVVPAAFVGWTPAPTKATAKRIAEYATRCRWAAIHKSQLKTPLIADIRGPYTALLFVDERDNYERYCLYGPHVGLQGSAELTAFAFATPPGPRGIQHGNRGGSCNPADGKAVSQMHGQVGAEVIGATFVFANGAKVEATVRKGYYFAWWPWAGSPKAITVYTRTGMTHITMPAWSWKRGSGCRAD